MKPPALVLLVSSLLLGGCQLAPPADTTLSVVVGLYPYAYLAEAIGGDQVSVTNLTKPGAEPHDLELTTQQVIAIAQSDLTIYNASLQPAVDAAVAQAQPAHIIEASATVSEHLHAGDGGHDQGTLDPHTWLDPTLMIELARPIAAQLSAIDPANAALYDQGLADLVTELTSLDAAFRAGLADCQRRDFITTHAAFGYLAERYNLNQIAISGLSPDNEPSPARIAEIQRLARDLGLTTIFFETLASPELAQTIAGDLGLRTDVLDPIEGITDQSRGRDYGEIMESNLAALRQANGCQ